MIPNYHTSRQDLLKRVRDEIGHLHYHSFRPGTMPLIDEVSMIQHMINDLQSLVGYGTASEPYASGEKEAFHYALTRCHQEGEKIVFDVGAHEGEYLKTVERAGVKFHCFEPEPGSFEKLRAAYAGTDGFFLNNFALSDFDGSAPLYAHQPGAAQAALDKPDFAYLGSEFKVMADVPVRSLASYCETTGIDQIDVLKIDTEGHELRILNAALGMIKNRRIHFIQFEFGICHVDTGNFFKDFWRLLSPHYHISRIHPEGLIPVEKYVQELEVFHVANYLCELKEKSNDE